MKTIFKNKYYAFRHGQSIANEKGIILSNPDDGVSAFGLSQKGKKQVLCQASKLKDNFSNNAVIFSSDFKRAFETASLLKEVLDVESIHIDKRLRERFFGDFDKMPDSNYDLVWGNDLIESKGLFKNVESVISVYNRTSELVEEIELNYVDSNIFLVSHGDALQILQTYFEKINPAKHRSLDHLETATPRLLNRED